MLFVRITLVQFRCLFFRIQYVWLVRCFLLQNNCTRTGVTIGQSFSGEIGEMLQIPLGFPVRCVGNVIDQNAAFIWLTNKFMMLVKIRWKILVLGVRIFLFPAKNVVIQDTPHLVRIVLRLQCNQVVVNGAVQFLRIILHCDLIHHVVILLPHDSIVFVCTRFVQLHSRNAFNGCAPFQVGIDKCYSPLRLGTGVQFICRPGIADNRIVGII